MNNVDTLPNFDLPNLTQTQPGPKFNIFIIVALIIIGVGVGMLLATNTSSKKNSNETQQNTLNKNTIAPPNKKEDIQVGKTYGNESTLFKDVATGVIQSGNINGVGTHILERVGGPSQHASLTSSTVDLDLFLGKKVEIKGQTQASNKTGWLLDVGTIKVLE